MVSVKFLSCNSFVSTTRFFLGEVKMWYFNQIKQLLQIKLYTVLCNTVVECIRLSRKWLDFNFLLKSSFSFFFSFFLKFIFSVEDVLFIYFSVNISFTLIQWNSMNKRVNCISDDIAFLFILTMDCSLFLQINNIKHTTFQLFIWKDDH